MSEEFDNFVALMCDLRKRCPWDAAQSMYFRALLAAREARELEDASITDDTQNICEETGDVLCNIVALAIIAEEQGLFTMTQVIGRVHAKMVSRHKSLFGNSPPQTAEEANQAFLAAKTEERKQT